MACHYSKSDGKPCVGWLHHQLGDGNNIWLRMQMWFYEFAELKIIGEQHKCFEDILPKGN